jgi:hypothetical protein
MSRPLLPQQACPRRTDQDDDPRSEVPLPPKQSGLGPVGGGWAWATPELILAVPGHRVNMVAAAGYALPTHSSVPSVNRWCFQIGTVAFSSSISAWHAWKASARCAQDTPTTTARSPTAKSPIR